MAIGCAFAVAQGGQGGVGGQQGGRQAEYDRSVRGIESAISTYSLGEEIKNILTPGEYSEWTLTLKAGQVVVGEVRSDAFDPALEIVNEKGKVLATNDDRYPGDQRPLLVWRCETAGTYMIRARCFRDKAGGQFFIKFNMYHSMDLTSSQMVEKDFPVDKQFLFLFRIPMKAGQVKLVSVERPTRQHMGATLRQQIGPTGLPNVDLVGEIAQIGADPQGHARGINVIMAPVDGDYYIFADAWGANPGKLRAAVRDLAPAPVGVSLNAAKAVTDQPSIWSIAVKKGDFLEISTPELHLSSRLELTEATDLTKFSLEKPDKNPFYPRLKGEEDEKGPAFVEMAARANDPRIKIVMAKRDAVLWFGSNGTGPDNTQYTLNIKPAARTFEVDKPLAGKLRIGSTDYWAFDAKVGDVMTFNSGADGFAEQVTLLGPDGNTMWGNTAQVDQDKVDWSLIARKPGRYLVSVSCRGDGGGGAYSLARKEFGAKVFGKGKPASGEISGQDVQIWKFTATPNEPLSVHWRTSGKSYTTSIIDDMGEPAALSLMEIDAENRYGILKVDKPRTFLIVLMGNGPKSTYSIDIRDLPR